MMPKINVEINYESTDTHELDLPEEFEGKDIANISGKWDQFRIEFTDGTHYDFETYTDPEADVKYPSLIMAYGEDYNQFLGEW